jgi:hypothetical protein
MASSLRKLSFALLLSMSWLFNMVICSLSLKYSEIDFLLTSIPFETLSNLAYISLFANACMFEV